MCIRHTAQHIAIATLYLALNSYGVELPVGEKEWWQVCICIQYYHYHTSSFICSTEGRAQDYYYIYIYCILYMSYYCDLSKTCSCIMSDIL